MKIGIGITTRNRPTVFMQSLTNICRYLPPNAKLVVVDDASDVPTLAHRIDKKVSKSFIFNKNVGIGRAKNKCLELLDDCDHIFLFDDDTYPIAENWWKPYIESKEPHLMYQFRLPSKPDSDMRELFRDEETVAYSHTRGCMIYIDRKVLDVVGGMDTIYGEGMFEHTDWTNRIHNAGLTSYRAMDVVGSSELLYCLDQDSLIESSLSKSVRGKNIQKHAAHYHKSKFSKEYKDYK